MVHDASRLGSLRRERLGRQGRRALALRVGLRERVAERSVAVERAQHEHEAVLAHLADECLVARELDAGEALGDLGRDLGRHAPRAPVGDVAVGVDGAEIAACGEVVRAEREIDAGGLQHPAADLDLKWIVAEEAEVARPRAGRDAVPHGYRLPDHAVHGQAVEVEAVSRLKLGAAARTWQPAEAIEDAQHDLAVGRDREPPYEFGIHGYMLCERPA